MKQDDSAFSDLERLLVTGETVIKRLHKLSQTADKRTAELSASFLEMITRKGINSLVALVEEKPETLKARARVCSDWPGFVPEHKAARDANATLKERIELGRDVPYKTSHTDLSSPLQEMAARFFFELSEARAMYRSNISQYGAQMLPEWTHRAASLPKLPGTKEDCLLWFECGWEALQYSCDGDLSKHPMIVQIGYKKPNRRQRLEDTAHEVDCDDSMPKKKSK